MTEGERHASHLVSLVDDWGLWKLSVLRGAGFPASTVLRLAQPDLATKARAALELEDREARARRAAIDAIRREEIASTGTHDAELARAKKLARKRRVPEDTGTGADVEIRALREVAADLAKATQIFEESFDAARTDSARITRELAADERFREAVSWQNRAALERYEHAVERADPADMRTSDRRYEELIVSYLHRYCTKNDTIGFFGPVGWARFSADEPSIVAKAGPSLLAHRSVHFEQWPIDALARSLTADDRFRRWAAPRRFGFVRIEDGVAHSPINGRHTLSPAEDAFLRACDGLTPAVELGAQLVTRRPELFPSEDAVSAVLTALVEKQLVDWSFEFRTTWEPQRELEARLERIGDAVLRSDALARLGELDAGRKAVAAAAGKVVELRDAQKALDEAFTRLTGTAHTRHAGATYAGRTVVFEDARRDFELVLGRRVIDDIAPALSLVLASARWLTHEVGRACAAAFREIHGDLAGRLGTPRVPFTELWLRAQRYIHGAKDRAVDVVETKLRDRWSEIFDPVADPRRNVYESAKLRPLVERAFAAPKAGWNMAQHHSPDLMIGAKSAEAIAQGDYLVVLGEVHVGLNTIDNAMFASQHPAPDEIRRGVTADARAPRVILVPPKHSPLSSVVRESRFVLRPEDFEIETGFEASLLSRERVLALAELFVVARDGELVVTRDDGLSLPLLDVMGQTLSESVANSLSMFSETEHSPRVTIDRLVVHRESWRVDPAPLEFPALASESSGFLGATRWASELGLPRFVFVRSELEVKPIFVDLESTASVRVLRKLMRRAQEHPGPPTKLKISEMLPDLEHAWLFDASGARYTSELRLAAVDLR